MQPISAVTTGEATAELADAAAHSLRAVTGQAEPRPRLMPLRPPAPGWVLPRPPAQTPRSAGGELVSERVRRGRGPGPVTVWADIDGRDDHYLGLPGASVVATEALLVLADNLVDVVAAKAMMCVHGDAGLGKTLSVNAGLRALAPDEVCRVQFRARPTPRDIRHVLFEALGIGGTPPSRPIEFDALVKRRAVRTVPGAGLR